jgi:branched-chain amino acid aminotransferase
MTENQESNLYAYVNGKYILRQEASISIYDHGFLYGDGVYEAIRAYDGLIFKLQEHLDRLYESAKSVKIDIPLNKKELGQIVVDLLKRNKLANSYVRMIISRGAGKMGVDPRNCTSPTIVIITEPRDLLFGTKGISAIVSSVRRTSISTLDPRIKTLNYMNNIMAKMEAIEGGVEEAIMLNEQGYVAETSTENIFIVKGNVIVTPDTSTGILRGITRDAMISIAKELGYQVEERSITIHEVYNADEAFVTGTAAESVPLIKVSGRVIGDGKAGPVFTKIADNYRKVIHDPKQGMRIA